MRTAGSKPTARSTSATSATPPAKHSPSGSANNAVGRAATASSGQGGASSGGASWTAELEGGSPTPGADAQQGVPIDTSPSKPQDAGSKHGNYKGG